MDYNKSLLDAALRYAQLGWKVFPLAPGTKIPLLPESWPAIATTNEDSIRLWWFLYPDANIAVVAGSELTILDVDNKPGKPCGWDTVGGYVTYGTPCATTPNGGMHFYYKGLDERLASVPGVDVQQGNQYVVAPPSRVRVGECVKEQEEREYAWVKEPEAPWDDGIAEVDEELKQVLGESGHSSLDTNIDIPTLLTTTPEWPWADLTIHHWQFLRKGEVSGFPSRSEVVHSLAANLYLLGFQDAEVLSLLWSNPWVQDAAVQHRRGDEDRGLAWVWDSCKKTRKHRVKTVEEVFGPVAEKQEKAESETPRISPYQALLTRVTQLKPGDEFRSLLQELVLLKPDPVQEDEVLEAVRRSTSTPKAPLKDLYKRFKAQAKQQDREEQDGGGPRWKHVTGENLRPLGTIENLEALLKHKQARVRHNLMTHRIEMTVKGDGFGGEEGLNNQLTVARSWAAEYGMPMDSVPEQLVKLASDEAYHPFKEYLESQAWDGYDRLPWLLKTIKVKKKDEGFRDHILRRWLVSLVAAVCGYGSRAPRGVLTFTGRQGVGKSTWLRYLVPAGMYHQGLILRPDQRDSATKGLRYLLVEIGELDATYKAQTIEMLKSYIGQHEDVYRLSYARDESRWKRQTIFAASANQPRLLHDMTGNTRWWCLNVEGFDLNGMEQAHHDPVFLQQLWAQVHHLYKMGEPWDLTDAELIRLEAHNEEHIETPLIVSTLMDTYEWDEAGPPKGGYSHPRRIMDILADMRWDKRLGLIETRQLRDGLVKLTGQRNAKHKRIRLLFRDGERLDEEHQEGKLGRWWYMPKPVPGGPLG